MNTNIYHLDSEHMYINDLGQGIKAVRLIGDSAVNNTAGILQISTKKWQKIAPDDRGQFYSLYAYNNRPLVLIWVQNNAVRLCRAINNARPIEYTSQIVTFIVSQQFDIATDMACTGIVRQKGRYYNIYDLPQRFIYNGDMDLSFAGLYELPDMSTVTIHGNYDIRGNRIRRFDGAPREVFGDFDVSGNWFPHIASRKLSTIIHGKFINDLHLKQHR